MAIYGSKEEGDNNKICPLMSKVSTRDKITNKPKDYPNFVNCFEHDCGFWDTKGGQCSIATLGDIANALWNKN